MKTTVVGMGELLWDVLTEGKRIGGAPANFAYHVSQFGFDSHVVSAVGNDADGDEIVEVLRGKLEGIEVARVPFPTGTVQVSLDAAGVPPYEIKEGVAGITFRLPHDCANLPPRRVLCVSGRLHSVAR